MYGRFPRRNRRRKAENFLARKGPAPRLSRAPPPRRLLPAPADAALRAACGRLSRSTRFASLKNDEKGQPLAVNRASFRSGISRLCKGKHDVSFWRLSRIFDCEMGLPV